MVVVTSGLKTFLWIALLLPNALGPRRLFLLHTVNYVLDLIMVSRVISTRDKFVNQPLIVGFFL